MAKGAKKIQSGDKDSKIHFRDHFSSTYQAASALVLNGKLNLDNIESESANYDDEVIRFANKLLRENKK